MAIVFEVNNNMLEDINSFDSDKGFIIENIILKGESQQPIIQYTKKLQQIYRNMKKKINEIKEMKTISKVNLTQYLVFFYIVST